MKNITKLLNNIFSINIPIQIFASSLCYDSRSVISDSCFIALSGAKFNGENFIPNAISAGAKSIIVAGDIFEFCYYERTNIPIIKLPDLRENVGEIASCFYDKPSNFLDVVGVTGTNGKSSLVFLIASALEALDKKAAFIGTIGYGSPGDYNSSERTTEPPVLLQQRFSSLRQNNFKSVAIEVSSHAVVQHRIAGTSFNCLFFTNLSPDHIDFHGDYNSYKNAKFELFNRYPYLPIIVNGDDEAGRELLSIYDGKRDTIYFSQCANKCEARGFVAAKKTNYSLSGTTIEVDSSWGSFHLSTKLIGTYNCANVLALSSYLLYLGYTISELKRAVLELTHVPGRMEVFGGGDGPIVILDYAHNGAALEGILQFMKSNTSGNISVVFGCGGDRPKQRRYDMGSAASKLANKIILTYDNPRSEDPNIIYDDIKSTISDTSNITIINDRAKAISFAIKSCKKQDVVLVSGKGHEQFQEIAGVRHIHSDVEVIEGILKS